MDDDLRNFSWFREVDSLLEEGLSTDLSILFHDYHEDDDIPDPEDDSEENYSDLVSLLISELECPVCYQPFAERTKKITWARHFKDKHAPCLVFSRGNGLVLWLFVRNPALA